MTHTTSTGWRRCLLGLALVLGSGGCARMSQATPKLSAELGDRIAEMRGLHELTLDRFFDAERRRIEDFINREWTPLFLRNFLGTSNLLGDINESGFVSARDQDAIRTAATRYLRDTTEAAPLARDIAVAVGRSRGAEEPLVRQVVRRYVDDAQVDKAVVHLIALLRAEDPATLILEWAGDAQEQINIKREEMLAPIDEAEREAKSELAKAYAEMSQANGTITGRLEAAAKASTQQDALLNAFGVDSVGERLRHRLGAISTAVGSALSTAKGSANTTQSASELGKILLDALQAKLAATAKD